jgi:MSHA biogenesis protein MshP
MKQRGFSLIMAIFLIVVLGGIAVFMGRVLTMQAQSSALDEQGAMVYQAARSGLEWGVYRAIVVDDGSGTGCVANATLTKTFDLPVHITATSTVNYPVIVQCAFVSANEAGVSVSIYTITSTAHNAAAGRFYVERQLTATVSK